ncbi:sugar ABC transporter substrate-binding protein [Paracoccus sp. pheM1]|uniref:ABC transporter substrate-binding protein n=1 Tax=Paracoccus sp. pheM1 TaxID=2831675 RepID=UPI000923BD16|nr:sugar ABC transporter substrate-binding protein [Paracoccus sp. pheM1]MBT0779210.1 sugar ABC transporter substrate-binding protein [Paracoccus sp. pheM1]SFX97806.1 multiple sugar transport system substrate-binding protein [Paracoccus pantotrophus]
MRIPTTARLLAAASVLAGLAATTALAQDKPYEGVTLRVLSTQQPWDAEIEKRVAAFEEETGADVQFDLYAFGQAVQKIGVELSTGSPAYDVFFLEASDVPRYAAADRLAPFDDAIAAREGFDSADFIPTTLEAFKYEGKQMGVPYFAATQLNYWRGPVLAEAGFDKAPETFEDMLSICKALKEKGVAPCTALRGKPNTSENVWYWTQIMLGEGGHWVKDYPKDMTPTLNSPEAVRATEIYAELLNEHSIPGSVSAGYDEVVVAMQQGNIAMAIEGAPLAGRILDPALSKVQGELGFAPPPGGPAGRFAPFNAQGWAVGAGSKNVEAAQAFVLWATSKETVTDVTLNSSFLAVTRQSVWNDPAFTEKHGYDFGFGEFTKAYAQALADGDPIYRLPIPEFRAVGDRVGLALQEVVTGRRSAQEALDAAQADTERMFRRAGYID